MAKSPLKISLLLLAFISSLHLIRAAENNPVVIHETDKVVHIHTRETMAPPAGSTVTPIVQASVPAAALTLDIPQTTASLPAPELPDNLSIVQIARPAMTVIAPGTTLNSTILNADVTGAQVVIPESIVTLPEQTYTLPLQKVTVSQSIEIGASKLDIPAQTFHATTSAATVIPGTVTVPERQATFERDSGADALAFGRLEEKTSAEAIAPAPVSGLVAVHDENHVSHDVLQTAAGTVVGETLKESSVHTETPIVPGGQAVTGNVNAIPLEQKPQSFYDRMVESLTSAPTAITNKLSGIFDSTVISIFKLCGKEEPAWLQEEHNYAKSAVVVGTVAVAAYVAYRTYKNYVAKCKAEDEAKKKRFWSKTAGC